MSDLWSVLDDVSGWREVLLCHLNNGRVLEGEDRGLHTTATQVIGNRPFSTTMSWGGGGEEVGTKWRKTCMFSCIFSI